MILAVDPGNEYSAYVLVEDDFSRIIEKGKVENKEMLDIYENILLNAELEGVNLEIAIEMIASYGMAVGKTVFETCVFIGRLVQITEEKGRKATFIYRKDEKMVICYSMKANDASIRRELIDLFAAHDFKRGTGTKKNPDYFYGVTKDIWAAFAVAYTYKYKEGKGE